VGKAGSGSRPMSDFAICGVEPSVYTNKVLVTYLISMYMVT
jgi:hypothetical protein